MSENIFLVLHHFLKNCFVALFCMTITDVDECSQHHRGINCQHTCINTPGSYVCSCRLGYHLAANQRSCIGRLYRVPISLFGFGNLHSFTSCYSICNHHHSAFPSFNVSVGSSKRSNTKIDSAHKRAFRILDNDYNTSIESLLRHNNSRTIYIKIYKSG